MTHAIIIVTMNRAAELDRLLRSLFAQTHPVDQIIVVDGGTDAVFDDVYKSLTDPRVQRLHTAPGISAQRNRGLDAAMCDIVTFVDDDAVLSPQYVEHVMDVFGKKSEIAAIGGINGAARFPGILQRGVRFLLGVQTGRGMNRMRRSGFPDLGRIPSTCSEVGILPSTALSLNRAVCEGLRFEEYWLSGAPLGMSTGRCFGEDVYFTLQLAGRGRLCILPTAVFHHEASPRNRESTYITQALYVFAMRWISHRYVNTGVGRAARAWALLGQFCINLAQTFRFADSGYIRGYLKAMTAGMK